MTRTPSLITAGHFIVEPFFVYTVSYFKIIFSHIYLWLCFGLSGCFGRIFRLFELSTLC